MPGRVQPFNPGVEIIHVIAKKINPVNRTEFNPAGLCNRPLSPQNRAAERLRGAQGKTVPGGPYEVIIVKREKQCFTIYYTLLHIIPP